MNVEVWLVYVATVLLFMVSPGPSHLLMVSVGMANGFQKSLATAAGDLSANAFQIALAGFGLAAVVTSSRYGFAAIKWAGVAYLVWIGIKTIRASFSQPSNPAVNKPSTILNLYLRGFITSAANPKAVVFFAALFPQFLTPSQSLVLQVFVLGVTYIVIDGLFLLFYGFSSSWLAQKLHSKYHAVINRISGIGLIGTAILLGFKKSEEH
jgi:threonine/homoserine/homoserine lactone efflux protein